MTFKNIKWVSLYTVVPPREYKIIYIYIFILFYCIIC